MPAEIVPASTKIRTSRVANIATERLVRRAAWLAANKGRLAREIDSNEHPRGRVALRAIAREIHTIDAELARRAQGGPT